MDIFVFLHLSALLSLFETVCSFLGLLLRSVRWDTEVLNPGPVISCHWGQTPGHGIPHPINSGSGLGAAVPAPSQPCHVHSPPSSFLRISVAASARGCSPGQPGHVLDLGTWPGSFRAGRPVQSLWLHLDWSQVLAHGALVGGLVLSISDPSLQPALERVFCGTAGSPAPCVPFPAHTHRAPSCCVIPGQHS